MFGSGWTFGLFLFYFLVLAHSVSSFSVKSWLFLFSQCCLLPYSGFQLSFSFSCCMLIVCPYFLKPILTQKLLDEWLAKVQIYVPEENESMSMAKPALVPVNIMGCKWTSLSNLFHTPPPVHFALISQDGSLIKQIIRWCAELLTPSGTKPASVSLAPHASRMWVVI